ncbi:translocation protein Sec62 [Ancylostoma ceylanicum]|uniref:Translocation protein SEC62 n=1 Tax=Ancylostoma ceylanicum TaxID=53326 RepID=A0A0D6MCK8_9BILA|nr:translocation protein Sec62 [Ancylostoma ceylanicum]
MSTKRKGGRKEENVDATPSKEQDAIARYVRFNCPTNTTMFQGNEVHYFSGSKAVDTLMDSKYGAKAKNEAVRQSAVNYMRDLMAYQLFFRARKLVPKKKEEKDKKEKDQGKSVKSEKGEKKRKEDETVTETEAEDKKEEKKPKDSKEEDDKKKKKKIKLEIHDVQVFNDDKDVYVWMFDPTPLYKKVIDEEKDEGENKAQGKGNEEQGDNDNHSQGTPSEDEEASVTDEVHSAQKVAGPTSGQRSGVWDAMMCMQILPET